MISELAKDDIQQLEEQGYKVPIEFIIRLNALGLKIKYHPECELATLPRIVIIDGHVIKQPTIRQQILIDDATRTFTDDDHTYLAVAAYILCSANDDIDESEFGNPRKFLKKVLNWLKDEFRTATADQLDVAVTYLLYGFDPTSGEFPVYMTIDAEKPKWDALGGDRSWALNEYLTAASVGIDSPAALRATSPQLAAMIERACVIRGCKMPDKEKKYTADYFSTLDSIKQLLKPAQEETENG